MESTSIFSIKRETKTMVNRCSFRLFGTITVVAILFLAWTIPAGAKTNYTVESIADALLEAEAKFTDLQLKYISTGMSPDDPNGRINTAESVYAQKIIQNKDGKKRLRYQKLKVTSVESKSGQRTLVWDTMASYNGQVTRFLNNKVEQGKPMEGIIKDGYNRRYFPVLAEDPHTKIWYSGGGDRLLGNFLKESKDKFHIESHSELVNGISTVKVVGELVKAKTGKSLILKLWVSPEHNFLPLKRQRVLDSGELTWEVGLYDLIELPNGLWYPKTIQSPAEPPGRPDAPWLSVCEILEISVDPITEKFFTLEFPLNTRVSDEVLGVSYTTQ